MTREDLLRIIARAVRRSITFLSERQALGAADTVLRDPRGFILAGRELVASPEYKRIWKEARDPLPLETSIPGVFAAGDVRAGSINRVASAVGEGAMAVRVVHEYLALT